MSSTPWNVHVFGVRHLSPAGAWHLVRLLDRVKPELVLIEGLSDARDLIGQIVRRDSRPPIALLAYTDTLPVRTLVYPMATYSPEYQAMRWADEHGVRCEFIDLPSDVFLALQDVEAELAKLPPPTPASEEPQPGRPQNLYDQFAQRAGERDYETYWERHFEHNRADESYRPAIAEFGRALRELEEPRPRWRAENLVREAFMRRQIEAAIESGTPPDKIVAVVGAFHAPVLTGEHPAMTDAELKSLRRRASKFTLMPYAYAKLSTQSGYGAGNHAPAYFEMLWESLRDDDLAGLPARYLSSVARNSRDAGTHRSTAEVIEAVRLSTTLSALHDGQAPTLADLRDAAITLIGHGEPAAVHDAIAKVDVGRRVGSLAEGVSRTSIQSDFDREMRRLKLDKYRVAERQELSLDLRENRHVKSRESAFLDLERSSFLHRLRVLGVGFGVELGGSQAAATWAERWSLSWSPENEIKLIEAVLLGETVELATAFTFRETLDRCESVGQAADVVADACKCGMPIAMEAARSRLQALSAETGDFTAVAHAAHTLGQTARYGDVRQFDPEPLMPLVAELFVQAALALHAAAGCDDEQAPRVAYAIDEMNRLSIEHDDRVDEGLWTDGLRRLSDADDRNALLSGYACAVLLERGLMPGEDLAREVSRRLSPGVPADLGAGWFEGLSKRNRHALLARQALWAQLADYVAALDEESFRRSVVFLRRAFGSFGTVEKRQVAENLAEHWGVHADQAAEALEATLSEAEEKTLSEIDDFDFDDL